MMPTMIKEIFCLQYEHCNLHSHTCISGIEAMNPICLKCKEIKLKEQEMAKELNYMAVDKEGRFVAVISPDRSPNEVAKETGEWIRAGLSVKRCTDDYVRQHFGDILK